MTGSDQFPSRPTALVIAGMHRSGTSLVASILADTGLHLGDHLLGPGEGNPAGHFEDLDFLALHQRILAANGLGTDGFTTQRELVVPPELAHESARLIIARRSRGSPWGWKEPRTTLFLNHWAEAIPEARFLLLFRRPWEVVDSLFRRGDPIFGIHPPLAVGVWRRYNEAIRAFHDRHPDRCLLVELTQVTADPAAFAARIRDVLGLAEPGGESRFQPAMLAQDDGSPRAGLLATIDEEAFDLYLDLRSRAGSASALPAVSTSRGRLTEGILSEWRRAATAERRALEADQRIAFAEHRVTTAEHRAAEAEHRAAEAATLAATVRAEAAAAAEAELATCRTHLDQTRGLVEALQAHVAGRHEEIAELRRLLACRDDQLAAVAAASRATGTETFRRLGLRVERAIRACRDRCLGRRPPAGPAAAIPPEDLRPAA